MSSFSSLQKKYDDFSIPAYKITSDGSEFLRSEFEIDDIAVDNGMGETAGACRFSLRNVYERGSRQFNASALNKLKPGSKISVSLGYGSSLSEVFTGYIDEVNLVFTEEEIALGAFCLDARALMRKGSFHAAYKDKSIKDIVSAVLDKYSPLINSKDVTLNALEKDVNITQSENDLSFVQNAANLRGLFFYIDKGKAVISGAKDTVCVEFDWEQFGLEFGMRYIDMDIRGRGYDVAKMEAFSAQKKAKSKAKQASLLTVSQNVLLPPHLLGDAGKAIVQAKADTFLREAISGTLSCRGVPEAKLGQRIKINKFPFSALGTGDTFTVVSVSHSLSADDGYITKIGIGG